MSYYSTDAVRRVILDELSDFEVNDLDGHLTVSANVRIPIELPDDWEMEDGDEWVEASIRKEISLG